MAEQISQADDLLTYLSSAQQITVTSPPQAAVHPATSLLEEYADNGLSVEFIPE